MIKLYNEDNMGIEVNQPIDYLFADYVYENLNFSWVDKYWKLLTPNGVFSIMTDFHSLPQCWMKLLSMPNANFVSHYVWKNEWGNYSKRYPHQCFDNILLFSNGKDYKYYPERVQVPKATANTKLNPSGRNTKPATAWIGDICLTTTSKERIKKDDGRLIKWQKPLRLMQRIVEPYTDEGDLVVDPFMGVATLGHWCLLNNREYVGIENNKQSFDLAEKRLKNLDKNEDVC